MKIIITEIRVIPQWYTDLVHCKVYIFIRRILYKRNIFVNISVYIILVFTSVLSLPLTGVLLQMVRSDRSVSFSRTCPVYRMQHGDVRVIYSKSIIIIIIVLRRIPTFRNLGFSFAFDSSSSKYVLTPILQSITHGDVKSPNKSSSWRYTVHRLLSHGNISSPFFVILIFKPTIYKSSQRQSNNYFIIILLMYHVTKLKRVNWKWRYLKS